MTTTSENNKRIAKNTLMLYIRMLLMMVITLYTSRIVLDKLGVTDYGIYNVVGGIVAVLGFLNGAMANTVQRFLSFELGKNNSEGVHRVFCLSLLVHIIIAVIVALTMEIFGVWYVNNYLNIPLNRLSAAHVVLQCTILTTVFTIMQVPYNAIIISKERMGIYAYISILEAILKLGVVFLLGICTFDRLKFYSILVMLVTIGILIIYRIYCIRKYRETRFQFVKDKRLLRQIISFAGWNMTSEIAWALTGPGVNMILNFFYGPIVNAAMGIAQQVNGAVSKFVQNFQTAVNPQIIKLYSSGNINEMGKLVERGSRYSFYLLMTLSLPLILQMDYILHLWLTKVPDGTVLFCQLILLCSLVSVLSNLLPKVAWATGNIRNYQIIVSSILVLNFPLSYLVLKLGAPAFATIIVNIAIQISLLFVRMLLTSRMVGLSVASFFNSVLLRSIVVFISAAIIPTVLVIGSNVTSFLNFLSITLLCIACCLLASYYLGMDRNEQKTIKTICMNNLKKIVQDKY